MGVCHCVMLSVVEHAITAMLRVLVQATRHAELEAIDALLADRGREGARFHE
jgi:hypothetical protein